MLGSVRFVARDAVASGGAGKEADRKGKEKDGDDPAMLAKRKDAGLEWMSVAPNRSRPVPEKEDEEAKPELEEQPRANPRELNPYLKDGGEGFPEEENQARRVRGGVGDGGASWLLKGLKRAQERASREGTSLPDVISDRWGSIDAFSGVSNKRAAHSNAHLHAIRDRKRKYEQDRTGDQPEEHRMRAPKTDASLRWRPQSRRKDSMRSEDAAVLKAAAASYNTFENDGSFMEKFKQMQQEKDGLNADRVRVDEVPEDRRSHQRPESSSRKSDDPVKNKIAAIQSRARESKSEKIDTASRDDDPVKRKIAAIRQRAQDRGSDGDKIKHSEAGDDAVMTKITATQRHAQEHRDSDADALLASKIYRSKDRFRADDEYDDVGIEPETQRRKTATKKMTKSRDTAASQYTRIQTQSERCRFCFENPTRPKHLTVAIGNLTYLMLPPTSALVPGHCYIVPSQHEGSTRNVDDDVWDEIRNFKKCLIKMFKEQEQDVIFMETAMNLSQQRRHCLIECIPVPPDVLRQAPLYFKKAIDEAEEEWSQHNAKKLIDTRGKGLRSSIPKNFPYFHVEFGLEGGYCHVIDNEQDFDANLGRNVLIGMLKLPQETMHQKAKRDSIEHQSKAVKEFMQQWKHHDWTQMLQ